MKLGVSTYSLSRAVASGEMTVPDVIRWIAEAGGQHVEVVPFGFSLTDNSKLLDEIVRTAAEAGVEISNYAIGANFRTDDDKAFEAEVKRVMDEVDIAHALGAKRMRHDVASRENGTSAMFVRELPKLAEACRRIADYAATFGITMSVENHGYYIQHSDRVTALIEAVGRPNFRLTMDVGNFMCADEESVSAVKKTVSYASMVHLKDFYLRPAYRDPGEGWFRTLSGNHLRGAIVGQGDIDMREALRVVKASGYDGYVSIEFEGMEECKQGTRIGLANARRLWDEA